MKNILLTMKGAALLSVVCAYGLAFAAHGADNPLAPFFEDLPEECSAKVVSQRLTDLFLSTRPENYKPVGYFGNNGYGWDKMVQYSVVSLWVNAIECARLTGDEGRKNRLVRLFDDFRPRHRLYNVCSRPYHVDDSVFGALPYEIYLATGDRECLEMGNWYADTQWSEPCFGTYVERHNAPREEQWDYYRRGFSPQTRLWIDDMYMITALQSQAFRATGDRKHIERAAKEMCFYLEKLQLKEGDAKGLFNHAPDAPFVWARGAGWMAAGMALVLDRLPGDSPHRAEVMRGYRDMMSALLRYQRADGLWFQLVDRPDDPENWPETSGSAMYAYAFMVGVRRGWLDAGTYGAAARRTWDALCARLDKYGNLSGVCAGTDKKNNKAHYYARKRVNGDPHGQAPMMWMATVLLGDNAERMEKLSREASRPSASYSERRALIAPVADGKLRLTPTFNSCGICYGARNPVPCATFEYRTGRDGEWREACEMTYCFETEDYRGSVMGLEEDTEGEVRVVSDGSVVASGKFKTWSSKVKVAHTVVLDPAKVKYPLVIRDKGTEDGWVRYTAPQGVVFTNDTKEALFVFDGASNVLMEGVVMRGGRGRYSVVVKNSRNVRIVNCEIAGSGRVGSPRYDALGTSLEEGIEPEFWKSLIVSNCINFDGAINIGAGSSGVVVERCYVHDPSVNANSWFYSHPQGGDAVIMHGPDHSTVLRWNDFVGSDEHRFNDAVESRENFRERGGFNRDADVNGNFMAFCADDCIELDGGQQNVRCFGNRFESGYCGVSIQGCMAGPVYVVGNAFTSLCDAHGMWGQTLKTGGGPHGEDARAFARDNLFWGGGKGVVFPFLLGMTLTNNVFCGAQKCFTYSISMRSSMDGNKFGAEIDEAALPEDLPSRPLSIFTDRVRLSARLADGTRHSVKVTNRGGESVAFRIRQNDDMPWFEVSPASGEVEPGKSVDLAIRLKPELMLSRRNYRGAFLVRTPEGLSRPVTLYIETDFTPPFKPKAQSARTMYSLPNGNVKLAAGGEFREHAFDVKEAGRYYFLVHADKAGAVGTGALEVAVDDKEPRPCRQHQQAYKTWTMLSPGGNFGNTIRYFDFEPGRHSVRFRCLEGEMSYDGVVLTDDPGAFEPRD